MSRLVTIRLAAGSSWKIEACWRALRRTLLSVSPTNSAEPSTPSFVGSARIRCAETGTSGDLPTWPDSFTWRPTYLRNSPLQGEKEGRGIPNFVNSPKTECYYNETFRPTGPFGGVGLGETVMFEAPPAVLNAIYDASGARVFELPATPERIRAALGRK